MKTVLILYGGFNESHEAAFTDCSRFDVIEGSGVKSTTQNGTLVINWEVSPSRRILQFDNGLLVYLIGRTHIS